MVLFLILLIRHHVIIPWLQARMYKSADMSPCTTVALQLYTLSSSLLHPHCLSCLSCWDAGIISPFSLVVLMSIEHLLSSDLLLQNRSSRPPGGSLNPYLAALSLFPVPEVTSLAGHKCRGACAVAEGGGPQQGPVLLPCLRASSGSAAFLISPG